MGAFGEIFGFDGRLDRLGYLWRALLAALLIALTAGVGITGFDFLFRPAGLEGAEAMAQRAMVPLVLASLWAGLALTSRRLRDMSLEPTYLVPLYAGLWVADGALLEPLSRLDPSRFGLVEQAWQALQWISLVALVVWPSREGAPAPAPQFQGPEPTSYLNWRENG